MMRRSNVLPLVNQPLLNEKVLLKRAPHFQTKLEAADAAEA
jgi:hypothetical protein